MKVCQAIRKIGKNPIAHLFYPQNCTSSPLPNSVFCTDCEPQVSNLGYPTQINYFLEYCGRILENFTKEERNKKKKVLQDICDNKFVKSESIGQQTGTSMILRSQIVTESNAFSIPTDGDITYSKDLTGLVTKNDYSRGHVFFCIHQV